MAGDGTGLVVTTEQCLLNPNRNPKMDRVEVESHLRRDLGKILLATVAMAGVVRAIHHWWQRLAPSGLTADAAGLVLIISCAAGFYAILLWVLRLEGREELAAIGQRFRERIGGQR